jgi:hypothetical protein
MAHGNLSVWYGLLLLALTLILLWLRFRVSPTSGPRWLAIIANPVLVAVSGIVLEYVVAVGGWFIYNG